MKRTLLVFLTLTTLVGFSACSKDDDNYYSPNKSFVGNIGISDWQYDSQNNYWYYDINVPALDSYYVDHGTVAIDFSQSDGYYESLPNTYEGITINFDYTIGSIRIYYRWAETRDEDVTKPAIPYGVKVVLSEADPI